MSLPKTNAARWLLLDNLSKGWRYSLNIYPPHAKEALEWAQRKDFVKDGRITDEGQAALKSNQLGD